ncbi:MAG: 16S rRNA (guanine(527)-N(7))-methyltransferase RsmG [Flavobacteriales bacterium]|nr:16S rRNA (guanine(527)-N(7))-methyltransferase RsmG [Flavobacteriales bacterium]|tara:strand:+ start:2432 stop:3067 length:636 start_codon:yes stop_codon:yes gene_type:complete
MEILNKYFPELSESQLDQFAKLKPLYEEWNQRINVISRKDLESFNTHHLLHSLGIAKVIHFPKGSKVLDVGTGGGFPGIPLAIFFPDVHFHLIDSIGKKIKVVEAVAEALNLKNVTAEQIRAEEHKDSYNFIVSRAVTRLNRFLPWVEKKLLPHDKDLSKGGMYFLKGGDLDEEISEVKYLVNQENLSDFFEEEFFKTKKVLRLSPFVKTK